MTGPRASVRKGVLLGIGAYGMWGLFPLYFPLLEPATPVEILGHRVFWTLVFLLVVLLIRRRWAWVRAIVHDRRRLTILTVASIVIAVNWGVYIWAVNNDRVVEAALGYFINPLVTVLLGVLVLHERLRVGQWVAVGLAAVAVVVLTAAYGRPPWIALTLALSFATYGLMKNRVRMPAVESLSVETTLLVVPAVAVLVWLQVQGRATFGHASGATTTLLAMAGVITAVPLLMFAGAASRVPLSTLGLLQYITPILQFLIGVLVVHEVMPPVRWVGFGLVWAALVLFSVDSLRAARASAAADVADGGLASTAAASTVS